MKKLLLFAFAILVPLRPPSAQAQQSGPNYVGHLTMYDSTGHVVVNESYSTPLDISSIHWLTPGKLYSGNFGFGSATPPFAAVTVGPSPTPTPAPPPVAPAAPPAVVTNCPNLAFVDNFQSGSNFLPSISHYGPITGSVKWITGKADSFGYAGALFQPPNPNYYIGQSGYATINLLNWVQTKSEPSGTGAWLAAALGTAAYANGGAVNGQSSGFLKAPPFYWEIACWIPPLAPTDTPNVAGGWPSISFYTDPAIGTAEASEIDLFELYSIDYTILHCRTHLFASGHSIGGYDSNIAPQPDLSTGWHVWGLWVDVATTHFYLDGVEVFNCPTPNNAPAGTPWYMVITPEAGGGFPICLDPSHHYSMQLAYARCWAQ